jgi:hypothetical protein
MLAKLSADILDRLDIFILEIEELQVPEVYRQYQLYIFTALIYFSHRALILTMLASVNGTVCKNVIPTGFTLILHACLIAH